MSKYRIAAALLAAAFLIATASAASAAEVEAGSVYCFTQSDFSDAEENTLTGVCVTDVPEAAVGTLMLGTRVVREGDILTAGQVAEMTFSSVGSEDDVVVSVGYLPIYESYVAPHTSMTIAIRGKQNKPPVAQDSAIETYKNLENSGKLKVKDPEGEPMHFTVTRQPKRGTVTIREDGSFVYTPKKNKVGVDSFTFTATDPAGNVSREATVTITILKPTDAKQYTDTRGADCRFTAEWMKNTGVFVAECVGGENCFQPEKTVTRGEFVTMLVKALEIPVEEEISLTNDYGEIPDWLKPYLAAAVRSGLTSGLGAGETFGANEPITGGEAAVMIQNALDLSRESTETVMASESQEEDVFSESVAVLAENGISLTADAPLSRKDAGNSLYLASELAERAAGMQVLRAE